MSLRPGLALAAAALTAACTHMETAGEAPSACPAFTQSGPAVDAVRALEEAGAASNVTGMSREDAERMFAPEYLTIGPDGKVTTREGVMKAYESGRSTPWADAFDIQELDIKVYCDMATAIGRATASGKGPDGKARTANFRWLNVWSRTGGTWRLVATQFARF